MRILLTSVKQFVASFLAVLALIAATSARAQMVDAIEFYNINLNHYFVTAGAFEISAIERGDAGPGWSRTGQSFKVWLTTAGAPANTQPVCRFYGNPALGSNGQRRGPNSHFYTVNASECNGVKLDSGWIYEGTAFFAILPIGGSCTGGSAPVYRLYNNRFLQNDSNHRYTTSLATVSQMQALGWSLEGATLCGSPGSSSGTATLAIPATTRAGGGCGANYNLGMPVGYVDQCIDVRNPGPGPQEFRVGAGQLFISDDPTVQNALVIQDRGVVLQAGEIASVFLQAFCINLTRHAATEGSGTSYRPGGITTNTGLLRIIELIRGKNIDAPERLFLVQEAVWDVTDGPGLTAEREAQLRAL